MKKQHLSIKAKLVFILAVFVVISTGAVVYSIINIKNQKSDALVINMAGRQRALTQALAKSTLGLHHAADEKDAVARKARMELYKNEITDKSKLFDDTLHTLINGGSLKDSSGAVEIPRTDAPEIRVKLDEALGHWAMFSKQLEIIVNGAEKTEDPVVDGAIRYIEDNNGAMFKEMNKLTLMYQEASDTKLGWFKQILYAGVVLNLITFAAVIWTINRLIISRLKSLHKHMEDITTGEGDLTKRIDAAAKDEIGVLGQEFNALLGNFEVIISKLMGSCGLLRKSSETLNDTFSSMVDGIGRQEQKTGQVATAMEEMSATVVEVARSASNMADVAGKTNSAAKTGETSMNKVVDRMNDIAKSTKKSVDIVAALGVESKKIGNIVQVINDIADQTNLLALNAAIEAARAGDQGRGFAVVADEVRKLAERTTRATKEIDEMITGIQEESLKAVSSIEKESVTVEEGVQLTKEAGAALGEITANIGDVNGMIQLIATSTEQQSAVASNISSDMEAVASISRESSGGVKGVSSLAFELSSLAHELEQTLSKFKVSGGRAQEFVVEDEERSVVPMRRLRAAGNE